MTDRTLESTRREGRFAESELPKAFDETGGWGQGDFDGKGDIEFEEQLRPVHSKRHGCPRTDEPMVIDGGNGCPWFGPKKATASVSDV